MRKNSLGRSTTGRASRDAVLARLAREEKFEQLKDALNDPGNVDPKSEALQEAFFRSVPSEDIELIDRFVALGVDVNGRWRNASVLTVAAKLALPEYVAALLDRGCDVNVQNADGDTALISVCQLVGLLGIDDAYLRDSERVAEVLIARGIDVNVANMHGDTALDVACSADWRPWPSMVRLLLRSGARLECCNNAGAEALVMAACYRKPEVLKMLLDSGAEVNGRSIGTSTPLMLAAAQGQLTNVKILLAAGADPNAKDIDGLTALEIARRNGHEHVVKILASR